MNSNMIGSYPLLLSPDNFTPLPRTPWAGSRIASHYKSIVSPDSRKSRIGESWEFSCDPDFPSRLTDGTLLSEWISKEPEKILGKSWQQSAKTPTCEILLKLINASQPLSLQIHPHDDDENLKVNECGKPESWLVLDCEPGSGLFLGFNQKIDRDTLRKILLDGDSAQAFLQFVEVKVGDYFEIEPGVPHAIGPGLTLLEPQRIIYGHSGKTYRFWDWGRKYDSHGLLDDNGSPRELHLEAALKIALPEQQFGHDFVESLRRKPVVSEMNSAVISSYPANPYYQVHLVDLRLSAHLKMSSDNNYGVLTVLDGEISLINEKRHLAICRGHSLLIPAKCQSTKIESSSPNARFSLVIPSTSKVQWG